MAVNHPIQSVDLTSSQFKADPFAFYAQLRAETPVYRLTLNRPANDPLWIITRYQDVSSVLKDERFVKDPQNALPPDRMPKAGWLSNFSRVMDHNMLTMDAPDHTR